jgi:hypothetical protein
LNRSYDPKIFLENQEKKRLWERKFSIFSTSGLKSDR